MNRRIKRRKPGAGQSLAITSAANEAGDAALREQQVVARALAELIEYLRKVASDRATIQAGFTPTIPSESALAKLIAACELSS
ncbi:MAG TPA: hypothetical protein VM869_09735, partial [Enhygromyxa sp.]|nr:hypothetical protein [Enhygromyxa sp.]